eukprot:tig00000178_g12826.t1
MRHILLLSAAADFRIYSAALAQAQVADVLAGSATAAPLEQRLAFDGCGTVALDSSGWKRHAQLYGDVSLPRSCQAPASSVFFWGSGWKGYVAVPTFTLGSPFSVSSGSIPASLRPHGHHRLGKDGALSLIVLAHSGSTAVVHLEAFGGDNAIPIGEYSHVTLVFTASETLTYLNGSVRPHSKTGNGLAGGAGSIPQVAREKHYISRGQQGESGLADGYLSDFRVYSSALSASQAVDVFHGG